MLNRVIADAEDFDLLRERVKELGIVLIAPYRKNNQEWHYEDRRDCGVTNGDGLWSEAMLG